MQVSLLRGIQGDKKMESEIKVLKEEMDAIRVYVHNLKDELIRTKSEKETLLIEKDIKDVEVHPIIQSYVQQVQDLQLQITQAKTKPASTFQQKRPTSWTKRFSSSSSLLSEAFEPSVSSDSKKYTLKSRHLAKPTSKRRLGSRPKTSYSPVCVSKRSQVGSVDNLESFFQHLQKEYEEPTNKIVLDEDLGLSFEGFSSPSFTSESNKNPDEYTSLSSSPSLETGLVGCVHINDDKSEALAVPTWSEDFKNTSTKRASLSVDSMWDDTDSSITTSNIGSTVEVVTTSTSFKNDRKQNRKLLKMIHQSQADFLVKQELVGQLEKSEDLYTQMQSNYESKLSQLREHLVEVRKQKDRSVKRNSISHSPSVLERPQSALQLRENKQAQELRLEYETKLKQLIADNQELRKKNTDLLKISRTTEVEADAVISQLQKSIEALRIQKKQQSKSLKTEINNAKKASAIYEREIIRLKRRETIALEAKNQLEKDNSTKNQLAKKRSEETVAANTQVRQLTNSLRKAASAGTFLNEVNLEKILNGISTVKNSTRRRSTISSSNSPILKKAGDFLPT
ncbi:hypothetical protein BY458DRAFT_563246 [Sporodiniella umbellata]|nr:hypothetical protein BY458DRAFT_563246 [Sporodiniella umbellata]